MQLRLLRPSDQSDSEREWITGIRAGDSSAFEMMFRAYAPRLVDFAARYVGSLSVAEDLVQDCFARMWEHRERLRIETTLAAYLHGAVRNAALNHLQRTRPSIPVDDVQLATTSPSALDRIEEQELADRVQAAVATLPERRRTAILLRLEQGMSYVEIAEVMGTSVKTVENQLARGWQTLRELLGDLR